MSLVLLWSTAAWAGSGSSGAISLTYPDQGDRYGVYEITITHAQSGYANVWEDMIPSATFTAPSGAKLNVDGFYYDTNTWKVRFAPDVAGSYSWSVSVGPDTVKGSFTSVEAGKRGFIRQHPTNPYRLVYEGTGELYNLFGFGSCFSQNKTFPLDSKTVDKKTYYEAMVKDTGSNIYRLSFGNCALTPFIKLSDTANTYDVDKLKITDEKVEDLRALGMRIFLDFYGFSWQVEPNVLKSIPAGKRYFRYMVARYGAQVDFWELINEASPSDYWIKSLGEYLKSIDPYQHLVAISWERPDHPTIDISAGHWYGNYSPRPGTSRPPRRSSTASAALRTPRRIGRVKWFRYESKKAKKKMFSIIETVRLGDKGWFLSKD